MPEEVPFKIEGRLPQEQLHQLFDFLERTSIGNSVVVTFEDGSEPPEALPIDTSVYAREVVDPMDDKLKLAMTEASFKAFAADIGEPVQVASRAWNAAKNGFNSLYQWQLDELQHIPRITRTVPISQGRHTIVELIGFEASTFRKSLHGLIGARDVLRNCGPATVAFYEAFLKSVPPDSSQEN